MARKAPDRLQEDHTRFILTPGSDWGDEAPRLSKLASALAGHAPSGTQPINGGAVAWQDAIESVAARSPVLVTKGTGRAAGEISRRSSGQSPDTRAVELSKSQLVFVANPCKQPDQFMRRMKDIYEKPLE